MGLSLHSDCLCITVIAHGCNQEVHIMSMSSLSIQVTCMHVSFCPLSVLCEVDIISILAGL